MSSKNGFADPPPPMRPGQTRVVCRVDAGAIRIETCLPLGPVGHGLVAGVGIRIAAGGVPEVWRARES